MPRTPRQPILIDPPKRVLVAINAEHVVGRRILEGIADYADQHRRWQLYLELTSQHEMALLDHVDGMIVSLELESIRQLARRSTVPRVQVTGPLEPDSPVAVVADNHAVGAMGAHYLADLGLKHLYFVLAQGGVYSEHRAAGFMEAARLRRVTAEVVNAKRSANSRLLRQDLSALPTPAGVMVATDRMALEVSRACRLIGKRIPEQVALLGVDNETEICRLVDPPLTSIDHGPRRIGYEAARLLDEWMMTDRPPERLVTVRPIGVVPRQSTDLLAIDDPDVVAAIRFIRSNFREGIKVKDVLNHVAVSRRSLEMRIRAALDRTIHDEIMRVRIDRAKQLLATSEWEMPHIAAECGFSLPSQFSFVFKRETAETPQAFRRRHRYAARRN
ncbi:MAG TPA: substrate-binding domain-containing protein [Tepidisphaeraceae bacterium]|jgi:LacI family transcriptional regulator|nr:substrate-binding domain-containing protein [Tepidisphaeraceae bacterium]